MPCYHRTILPIRVLPMTTHDIQPPETRTIKASEFKARCLKLMDEVAETGQEIVITKNGRPISRLTPYRRNHKPLFGRYKDVIKIHGDIDGPIDVVWEAEQGLIDGK